MTSLQRWSTNGSDYPTSQRISVKLFTIAASSLASEQNSSTMRFIDFKLENSLSPKTIENFAFLKSNLHALYGSPILQDDNDSGCKGGAGEKRVVQIDYMN